MRVAAILVFIMLAPSVAVAAGKGPDCSGPNRWPAAMAYTHLKNAGLLTPQRVDAKATQSTLVASEQIGADLYRQVHKVRFRVGGGDLEVITVSDASHAECSMGAVQIFVVGRALGG